MRTLFTSLSILFTTLLFSQPIIEFVEPVGGFNSPVDVTGSGDGSGRLFIVERAGRIRIYNQNNGLTQATFFLNITDRVLSGGEQGLLGVAFHPDYATNGRFYVNYTSRARPGIPEGATVIARFISTVGGPTAPSSTEQILLTIEQPDNNHNAGDLAFGPDGYLYIPTGDGGGSGDPQDNAQDFGSLLGKMLRIDVNSPGGGLNYGIPADNPYLAANDNIPDEIYAVGLRNPWRISFDRFAGDLWIGDVGQDAREEVNFQAAGSAGGQNYGWDCREGNIPYSGSSSDNCANGSTYTPPVFDYVHDANTGGFSVTGGFVYRGTAADLDGYYVCADFITDRLFLYETATNTLSTQEETDVTGISSFGEDDNGELYAVQLNGTLHRVTTNSALPTELTRWTATPRGKIVELAWATASEVDAADFLLERSTDGLNFNPLATQEAMGNATDEVIYNYTDEEPLPGRSYYRLVQRDFDGASTTYAIRTVVFTGEAANDLRIFPNPSAGDFVLDFTFPPTDGSVSLRVFSLDGQQVFAEKRAGSPGQERLAYRLPTLPAGMYQVLVMHDNDVYSQRLVLK